MRAAVVPVYSSFFIWSSESKHRLETICHFVYFKMAEVFLYRIPTFTWIYLKFFIYSSFPACYFNMVGIYAGYTANYFHQIFK